MTRRLAIVWNPSKTDKDTLSEGLTASLQDDTTPEVSWWETTETDPGGDATRRAVASQPDLIVVAGGDGTVRAVAEHLADIQSLIELGIVPLGTGNLLARNLDVPLNDIPAAFTRALTGTPQDVDMGWVDVDLVEAKERHGFVVMVGFGIDAHMIAETDDDLKDKAGWLAYVESLGRAFAASDVVPFANCGTLQGGFTLLPDADPSDGELDYLLLSAEGIAQWAGTLKTMLWDNGLKRLISSTDETTSTDTVTHARARKLEVTLPGPRPFEIDGEQIGDTDSFTVTIQPAALHIR
jgi:diacylglycerol kinase family enzyme